jgi:hypothetical protein
MAKTIFDSKAERAIYSRLSSVWSRYVDIYPQIPIRKVLGYNDLRGLPLQPRAIDYLMQTEFDFVVSEKGTGNALLAVEFDGIGHGFSRNGEYVSRVVSLRDPHRKLKLDSKLRACMLSGFPLVVVSFPETEPLEESGNAITVLDAIIGEVRATIGLQHLVSSHTDAFDAAFAADPSGDAGDWVMSALEIRSDYNNHPIRRKAQAIAQKLPLWDDRIEFLHDREGYVGVRRAIIGGNKFALRPQILLAASVYVRHLNCTHCDAVTLADCIAEYCLAKKALRKVGLDPAAWWKLLEEIPETDC